MRDPKGVGICLLEFGDRRSAYKGRRCKYFSDSGVDLIGDLAVLRDQIDQGDVHRAAVLMIRSAACPTVMAGSATVPSARSSDAGNSTAGIPAQTPLSGMSRSSTD